MIKQIFRFLSIVLISNLLFSHAVWSKTQVITGNSSGGAYQNKDGADTDSNSNQGSVNNDPNLEKMPPYNNNSGGFTTLYGVMNVNDVYNSYPSPDKTQPPNSNDDK